MITPVKHFIATLMMLLAFMLTGCAVELGNPLSSNEDDDDPKAVDTNIGADVVQGSMEILLSNLILDHSGLQQNDNNTNIGSSKDTTDSFQMNIKKIYLLGNDGDKAISSEHLVDKLTKNLYENTNETITIKSIPIGSYSELIIELVDSEPIIYSKSGISQEISIPGGSVNAISIKKTIEIEATKTTDLNVRLDLDSSIVPAAGSYEFKPVYTTTAPEQVANINGSIEYNDIGALQVYNVCLFAKKEDATNGNDMSKTAIPNSYDAEKYWEVNELPDELDFITISRNKDNCVSVSSTSFQFKGVPFGEYHFYFYLRNSYGASQPKPILVTINKNLTTVNFSQARTTQHNSDFTETQECDFN